MANEKLPKFKAPKMPINRLLKFNASIIDLESIFSIEKISPYDIQFWMKNTSFLIVYKYINKESQDIAYKSIIEKWEEYLNSKQN